MKLFDFRFIFTPLATTRTVVHGTDTFIGYITVYIFGIRIAKIQATNPWHTNERKAQPHERQ